MKILITGFAGFIGSNFTRMVLNRMSSAQVVGLDAYTYAARPDHVFEFCKANRIPDEQFKAVKVDLAYEGDVKNAIDSIQPDLVVHFAAESHVCNSINGPRAFVHSNIVGTWNLLESCRLLWAGDKAKIFHHVSTDEIFGELSEKEPAFCESSQIKPRSPYSASKAGSDHLVEAYFHTYGLNTRISNCSNNFGPNQHNEKLIPRTIDLLTNFMPMTVYGKGSQIRDWIWVDDHCEGILKAIEHGKPGERYCIGGDLEMTNIDVIKTVHRLLEEQVNQTLPLPLKYTNDRPTDDLRYAIDSRKLKALGWKPRPELFDAHIRDTISWYLGRMKIGTGG